MNAKKKVQLLIIFFALLWMITTVIFGGILVGLNLIVPLFSTLRLFLGVTILCFAMSVFFMIVKYKDILESLESSVETKE